MMHTVGLLSSHRASVRSSLHAGHGGHAHVQEDAEEDGEGHLEPIV